MNLSVNLSLESNLSVTFSRAILPQDRTIDLNNNATLYFVWSSRSTIDPFDWLCHEIKLPSSSWQA